MTLERDSLLEALAAAEVPPLPDGLATRTFLRASAHLGREPRRVVRGAPARRPILSFAVPVILASTAAAVAVDTCVRVVRIFGAS